MKIRYAMSLAALAAATALAGSAQAGVVYDTSLAAPGVWFGGGNINDNHGWTVNTVGGVELGLGTRHRKVGEVDPTTTNVYNVPTGPDASGTHAYWNFDFSVDLQGSGLTISDVNPFMTVTNLGNGTSIHGNPLLAFGDTQSYGAGGATAAGTLPGDYAFQNSENLTFVQFSPLSFNMDTDDTYVITLSLNGPSGFIGRVSEFVVVGEGGVSLSPLPAALPLFATGLGALGVVGWRRKRKAKAAA